MCRHMRRHTRVTRIAMHHCMCHYTRNSTCHPQRQHAVPHILLPGSPLSVIHESASSHRYSQKNVANLGFLHCTQTQKKYVDRQLTECCAPDANLVTSHTDLLFWPTCHILFSFNLWTNLDYPHKRRPYSSFFSSCATNSPWSRQLFSLFLSFLHCIDLSLVTEPSFLSCSPSHTPIIASPFPLSLSNNLSPPSFLSLSRSLATRFPPSPQRAKRRKLYIWASGSGSLRTCKHKYGPFIRPVHLNHPFCLFIWAIYCRYLQIYSLALFSKILFILVIFFKFN